MRGEASSPKAVHHAGENRHESATAVKRGITALQIATKKGSVILLYNPLPLGSSEDITCHESVSTDIQPYEFRREFSLRRKYK
ncbi:hypothetical protein TNIN_171461 [Trichonephila inaurata madagascariensis]|uniref:Uncharacterized protein n=1 Tax=Trichonephila inaurata madagascariensis TaxID=2747483 RepID=A0A8X6IFD7_9ARAC|nr:hypothetical protein TNIN_171461 [Trichonephila inaurata madagascariensis]